MFDIKELHDMEAESQLIDEVMKNALQKNQYGKEIIYGKQRKQDSMNNLRQQVNQLKKQAKHNTDGKMGTIDVIYDGDWSIPVPWPIVIAGKAISHGGQRLWIALRYHARRREEEKTCFPSAVRLADFMGISTVQLSKFIRELRKISLVGVHKEPRISGLGVINVYTLVDPIK